MIHHASFFRDAKPARCGCCGQLIESAITRGRLHYRPAHREVFWDNETEPRVTLTKSEGYVFEALLRRSPCSPESLRMLLKEDVTRRAVHQHIHALRGKLSDCIGDEVDILFSSENGYWFNTEGEMA